MPQSRVLSLWFPRLGAERLMRRARGVWDMPLAVVAEVQNMQVLSSLNGQALQVGLNVGQPVRDAHAMCPGLITRAQDSEGEAAFLTVLRRWAGKFSPWVAEHPPDGLVIDLTGCAHLFGGETTLLQVVQDDCADIGLHVRCGLADTLGAAWALARYAGQATGSHRNGDAIDQEARATRSRAGKRRHWTRGGAAPAGISGTLSGAGCIAPPGQNYSALSPLPVAALRLDGDTAAQLSRLGLRRIGDLLGQPRAGLARRFGRGLVLRLDQAMGSAPEPISPARAPDHFAVRMTLPDPIGLLDDLVAGLDRLLPRLCDQLKAKERGARVVRLQAFRADQGVQSVQIALARASASPDRIRPLLAMKLDRIEAGFGIDMLRLEAMQTEALHTRQAVGHLEAGRAVNARLAANTALDDLIGRIGARVGLDVITRLHPAASHIPEKTQKILAAAWSTADMNWPDQGPQRPVLMWRPEPVRAPDHPAVPAAFRWRGRNLHLVCATGPERIAPEWWLDDPDWRSGVRDYWVVTTRNGERLWLFYGHGGTMSAGWFCQGSFA